MIQEFRAFCLQHQLASQASSTLIAVSGGIDSVVLCHLFKMLEWPFAIAHCNFQLRGNDSDQDEVFCSRLAGNYGVPFYSVSFDTEKIALERKESIQLAARNLRYEWLEQIRVQNQFNTIATAHHINDRIETFLYNFTKGTGIRGLRSIQEKNGFIIRPLLFSNKANILAYAKTQALNFREDSSNDSTKYSRNKIRLEAVPVLKKINPNFEDTARSNFEHLKEIEILYLWALEKWRDKLLTQNENNWTIDLKKLQSSPTPSTLLFELTRPFGFKSEQVKIILSEHTNASGAQFFSASHRLLINREELIITTLKASAYNNLKIVENQSELKEEAIHLLLHWNSPKPNQFPTENNIALIDQNKLEFPLTLRRWEPGDSFHPLGMHGQSQKLKDYFINQKLSLYEKEQVWLLTSNGKICWIIGYRIDERFKVSDTTTQVLSIENIG